jgi:hypothetical protein
MRNPVWHLWYVKVALLQSLLHCLVQALAYTRRLPALPQEALTDTPVLSASKQHTQPAIQYCQTAVQLISSTAGQQYCQPYRVPSYQYPPCQQTCGLSGGLVGLTRGSLANSFTQGTSPPVLCPRGWAPGPVALNGGCGGHQYGCTSRRWQAVM